MSGNKFCIEYAKRGTAGCKKCKQKIDKQILRIARIVPNPFSDSGGDMKNWFHVDCIFDQFSRARATTKVVEDPSDLDGWELINADDKKMVLDKIKSLGRNSNSSTSKPSPKKSKQSTSNNSDGAQTLVDATLPSTNTDPHHRDNSFREFRRLCAKIADESSYNQKTAIIDQFFTKGHDGSKFQGDLFLWVKLLLPGVIKRVYNLQSKQLVKLFSQIFHADIDAMVTDLEQGDVAETIRAFFDSSKTCIPAKKSTLNILDVENFLQKLSQISGEDQLNHLKSICAKCTANDLKMVIRLIKHDLRINAGAKHVLDAVHTDAYQVFQASRNLNDVIEKVLKQKESGLKRNLSIGINLMTPVLPMLAEACKSVEYAMKKCPNGMYAEVKYDGERVQVHKKGNEFAYFSRSLKPVLPHKVRHFKDYIPKAFPHGQDLILDSEVLLIDTKTGQPLPFGTLNIHKKTSFSDANVCLFIFDCLMYNGDSLMELSIKERRKFLCKNMTEIPNRIMFSDTKEVHKPSDLKDMIHKAIDEGLEGLVLKDLKSVYEPGKRHWLKVKKDYLAEGAMADTADLVVLGAYFGTGNKGGMKSIFLMGCLNEKTGKWCTVTKVHGGHDDKTLERLQTELDMVKISKDSNRVPSWLNINTSNKSLIPDFVAKDPKSSQVWEITGAEFSKADIHTAHGISIRFPRITRIRDDKTWKTATTLTELEALFKASKRTSNGTNKSNLSNAVHDAQDESDDDTDVDEQDKKLPKKQTSNDMTEEFSPRKSMKLDPTSPVQNDCPEYDEDTDIDEPIQVQTLKRKSDNSKKSRSSISSTADDKPALYDDDDDTDVDEQDEIPRKKRKSDGSSRQKQDPKNLEIKPVTPASERLKSNSSSPSQIKKHSKVDGKYSSSSNNDSGVHQKEYDHSSLKFKPNGMLPDLFTDCKVYIPASTKKFDELKRYVIAFNGILVNEVHAGQATHIVNDSSVQGADNCNYITEQWLWDCIKLKKLLHVSSYKIK